MNEFNLKTDSVASLKRILSREAEEEERYAAMDKLKIGMIGISGGAGVSFLTGCLARYLANTGKHEPAVVELGMGTLFDSYGMDRRFAGRPYFHFYKALEENRAVRGARNMDEGINWILNAPEEEGVLLNFEQKLRLVCHAKGDIILCDFSGAGEEDFALLHSMDQIITVIDPLPSKMLKGYETLCRIRALELRQMEILYVVNKLNRGVNRNQMWDFLKLKDPVVVPMINAESIYAAEYNCKIPFTLNDVKKILKEPFQEIVSKIKL
ncbi:hypothetical protein FRZ06_08035 [Anoxybacterium hadale]|uniref:Uncharacterized protein n=1 Tax=Anoxybacterium hadale TaxID=3408580 RepID=A0ACD1AAR6_9FIRM|nr:hypothetical protein FRZ06_08035 [Clostridiales bacterium]